MKKRNVLIVLGGVFLIIVGIVTFLLLNVTSKEYRLASCDVCVNLSEPKLSPSEKFEIRVKSVMTGDESPNGGSFIGAVYDVDTENIVFELPGLADRHKIAYAWADNDILWLYSGDVGTYIFQENEYGEWEQQSATNYSEVELCPPSYEFYNLIYNAQENFGICYKGNDLLNEDGDRY